MTLSSTPEMLFSLSFSAISPIVNGIVYIGTFIFFKKNGIAPIWSSCPCVMSSAFILSLFFTRYDTSGITISIPSISSSGNISPQSITTMSFLYSSTVIFFPISFNPPSRNALIFADFLGIIYP